MPKWTQLLQNHKPFTVENENVKLHQYNSANGYGEGVVIKQIRCKSEAEVNKAEEEGRIAKNKPHQNIRECLGLEIEAEESGWFVYIFYEPMPRNLHDVLMERARNMSFFTEAELWARFSQILSALAFLEELKVAHRNVQPDNLFLSSQGEIKVGNFNFAKEIDSNAPAVRTLLGTMPYCSPIIRECNIKNLTGEWLQHDVFKSDVYSLGMVLLHLSLLSMPQELSSISGLQRELDKRIDSLAVRYSAEWRDQLKWLLRVKEEHRPKFCRVYESFQNPSPYSDDDPLAPQESGADISEPLAINVVCGIPFVRVSAQFIDQKVPCMVTVKAAPELNFRLGGIDIVCVIDQSGSMLDEATMPLIKAALFDLVELLGEQDRLSVVGFSDTAERKCPLTLCTTQGKMALKEHIAELRVLDLTNLTAGFLLGLEVLKQRRYPNQSCSILLFTDGKSNVGEPPKVCLNRLELCGIERLTVFCFGYGEQLDIDFLQALSEKSHGVFQHVANPEELQSVFVSAYKSLTRIVARDLRISLSVLTGPVLCDIIKVYSDDQQDFFSLPKLGANQQISFIFLLRPRYRELSSPVRFPTVQVTLTYQDSEGAQSSKFATLDVKFVKWGPEAVHVAEVWARWQQARAVACLHEVKQLEDVEAVKKCLKRKIESLHRSGVARHAAVQPVLSQLKDLQDGIEVEGVEHLRSFGRRPVSDFALSDVAEYSADSTASPG